MSFYFVFFAPSFGLLGESCGLLDENTRFAALRRLLALEPSQDAWEEVLRLFLDWPLDQELRETALLYAQEALRSWGELCHYTIGYVGASSLFEDGVFLKRTVPSLVTHLIVYERGFWSSPWAFEFLLSFTRLSSIFVAEDHEGDLSIKDLFPHAAIEMIESLEKMIPTLQDVVMDIYGNHVDFYGNLEEMRWISLTKKRGEAWDIETSEDES